MGGEADAGTATTSDDAADVPSVTPDEPAPADAQALGEEVGASAEDEGQSSELTTAEASAPVPQNTPAPSSNNTPTTMTSNPSQAA